MKIRGCSIIIKAVFKMLSTTISSLVCCVACFFTTFLNIYYKVFFLHVHATENKNLVLSSCTFALPYSLYFVLFSVSLIAEEIRIFDVPTCPAMKIRLAEERKIVLSFSFYDHKIVASLEYSYYLHCKKNVLYDELCRCCVGAGISHLC